METTSLEISERIAALDIALADAEDVFDRHAANAVAGVEGAGNEAAAAHARIDRLHVDRRILNRALDKAFKREADQRAAAQAEDRARHTARARSSALSVMEAARRVDALSLDLVAVLHDLSQAEVAVRTSLAAAQALPPDGVIGRHNIVRFAVERLMKVIDGRVKFNPNDRGVADVAAVAWAFLIEKDEIR